MREILFRGKTVREVWVYGLLAHVGNAWYISNSAGASTAYEVIPSTIEQYTGLKDKNGKKIFEGDIVCAVDAENCKLVGMVGWRFASWTVSGANWADSMNMAIYLHRLEVIGNIHDNPELLEVEHETD